MLGKRLRKLCLRLVSWNILSNLTTDHDDGKGILDETSCNELFATGVLSSYYHSYCLLGDQEFLQNNAWLPLS